jgi:5-methylcytosine-specific restriction endonuclease McrA
MSPRPCLGCGEPTTGSRCPDCAIPRPARPQPSRKDRHRTAAWDRLSARLRRQQPWCEGCGSTENLTADHKVPISIAPELALEPLNVRVLCRSCNSRKKDTCTAEEHQSVLDAIAARKRRRTAV